MYNINGAFATVLFISTFFICSCGDKSIDILKDIPSTFVVTRIGDHVQISVPSASGIAKHKDAFYAVGDNSPFLFRMDTDGNVLERILLLDEFSEMEEDEEIKKPIKPDFESMELIDKEKLYIIGSGSKSPTRDLLIIYDFDRPEEIQRISLTLFYEAIKKCSFMKGAELNIEGTALLNNRLYFFNRSNNCFFDYPLTDFNAISKGEIPFYEPRAQFLDLPKLKGIQAGVSGACGIKGNQIIFSASVEDTDNAYDDGEILGSFVGLLVLNKKGELEKMHISTIENLEQKKKVKVESICIHKHLEKNKLEVLLVTDNDGKASTFFKCLVELTN